MGKDDQEKRIGELSRGLATVDDFNATLRPAEPAGIARTLPEVLPELILSGAGEGEAKVRAARSADLEILDLLGEGGMGTVHLATQKVLGRAVAVKRLKGGVGKEWAERLVREAVITGTLEHPGIVPIHTLGRDAEGSPILVMKRVEGMAWRQLLREPDHPAWTRITGDRLVWHLQVLMQVCHAVEFAHKRRILHRDLKPDNVMIGDYGEVYVVDWGLAIDLERPPIEKSIVGTPAYLAPEMVLPEIGRVDERTDVYLLGAILHEVLTGTTRHFGRSIEEILFKACKSEPVAYGASVPRALAAIANRATHAVPDKRYPSASALREALASYLNDRASLAISEEAATRLVALRRLIADAPTPAAAEPVAVYRLYGECRFGFQEALKTAGATELARDGLDECIATLAEYEIARRSGAVAAVLLAELSQPRPALSEKLATLKQELAHESVAVHELKRMTHELDVSVGARSRGAVSAIFVIGFVVFVQLLIRGLWGGEMTVPRLVVISVALCGGAGLAAFLGRETWFKNAVNRRLAGSFGVVIFAQLMQATASMVGGVTDVSQVMASNIVIYSAGWAVIAINIDPRLTWPSLWFLGGAFILERFPMRHQIIVPLTMTGGVLLTALIWRLRTKVTPKQGSQSSGGLSTH